MFRRATGRSGRTGPTRSSQGDYPAKNRTDRGEGLAGGHPEFAAYIDREIARRRSAADPPDDFMTRLLRTEVEGVRLTDVEARTLIAFLLVSGNETTRHLLGNLLHRLATDPEVFAALRAERALVPNAVEESLRLEPPVAVLLRVACEPTEVSGVAIPTGARVAFGIASANRDERRFDEPDRFRLDRRDPKAHLGFGGGPHVCPGSALARLEGRVLLDLFVERVREIRLAHDYRREKVPVFWAEGPRALPAELARA